MASILIVDDDLAMREALCEVACDLGHEALPAASGPEALRLLEQAPIDAVLLDLRMPAMDGIEVLRRIRARSTPPPVVVLTAHATASNTSEAMRLDAFDHLTKPSGREEVALHGLQGDVNGALLEDGTVVRLPPPAADHLANLLQPRQRIVVEGTLRVTAMGRVIEARAIGASCEQLSVVEAPPLGPGPGPWPPPPGP